jgi:RNase P subunit RPR2
MTTFEELYCKNCGAPLSPEEMADNDGKNEICDACRDESEG